jgi:hypothetical protein
MRLTVFQSTPNVNNRYLQTWRFAPGVTKQKELEEDAMRLLTFVIPLVALTTDLTAQEETLLNLEGAKGGFGAAVVKFTSVNGQGAIMVGGRGGWIFDHSLVIGGGAYAVVNEINAAPNILPFEGPLDIEFGYLGFELEYIFNPNSLAHYSLYTFIGGGATNFVKDVGPLSRSNEQVGETAFMFILEPAANAELNITSWFRLNAGLSYRIAVGVRQVGLKDSDFTGLTATLTFKFGSF